MSDSLRTCSKCEGTLILVAESGRTTTFRGRPGFTIPASIEIPTCEDCGYRHMSSVEHEIEVAFAEQVYEYQRRQPQLDVQLIEFND